MRLRPRSSGRRSPRRRSLRWRLAVLGAVLATGTIALFAATSTPPDQRRAAIRSSTPPDSAVSTELPRRSVSTTSAAGTSGLAPPIRACE